jgi:hypothetical protein
LLEKDALDASDWLRHMTSNVDVSYVMDKNFFDPVGLGSERQKDKAILSVSALEGETANPSSLVKSSGNVNQSDPSSIFSIPGQLVCPFLPPGPHIDVSSSPPGYREPKEDDTSLHVILDSLIPFIGDPNSSVQLHVYLGNSILDPAKCVGEASSSRSHAEGVGKNFAWSRGLGREYSLVKTRSAGKKSVVSSTLDSDTCPSTDSGALRATKALAQDK